MPIQAAEQAARACAQGECENAIGLLENAVAHEPHDFRLYYRLGQCYGGGCRRHALVHPDMAIAYFRQALRLIGTRPGKFRAVILDQFGNTLCHSASLPRTDALRAAIECHVEAAEIYQALGMDDDWGRTQFNLGNSCCDLSEISGEDHWQDAVFHYEQSLRVRTREKDPERHAAALENLGSAYRRLSGGGDGASVNKSIGCYQRALKVYAGSHPEKSAALHNNLGNAFLTLPDPDQKAKARNARRALRHFDCALRVQSQDRGSRAYGITQFNRAQAYCGIAQTSHAALLCLEEAFAAFQSCGEDRYQQLVKAQLERIGREGS